MLFNLIISVSSCRNPRLSSNACRVENYLSMVNCILSIPDPPSIIQWHFSAVRT